MELNDKDLGGKKQRKRVKDVHEKKTTFLFNEFCRGWYHVQDTRPSLKAWIYTSGKRAECFLSLFCEKYAIPEVGIKSESFSYRLLKIVFWHSKVIAAKAIDINTYQQNFQSWWSWWYSCTCVLFVCLFLFFVFIMAIAVCFDKGTVLAYH